MKLNRRLYRFTKRINTTVGTLDLFAALDDLSENQTYIAERALMQLQIDWELFVRNLILDSATGRYCDGNGRVYSTLGIPTPTRERAGHVLIELYKQRQREPDWYLPRDAIKAANMLAVSNAANISDTLGLSPWVLDELRYVRNFIAHRSKQSALVLRQRNLVSPSRRISAVASAYDFNATGLKNYVSWSRFMKLVAEKLTA